LDHHLPLHLNGAFDDGPRDFVFGHRGGSVHNHAEDRNSDGIGSHEVSNTKRRGRKTPGRKQGQTQGAGDARTQGRARGQTWFASAPPTLAPCAPQTAPSPPSGRILAAERATHALLIGAGCVRGGLGARRYHSLPGANARANHQGCRHRSSDRDGELVPSPCFLKHCSKGLLDAGCARRRRGSWLHPAPRESALGKSRPPTQRQGQLSATRGKGPRAAKLCQ
jgi:hypothetical protein